MIFRYIDIGNCKTYIYYNIYITLYIDFAQNYINKVKQAVLPPKFPVFGPKTRGEAIYSSILRSFSGQISRFWA